MPTKVKIQKSKIKNKVQSSNPTIKKPIKKVGESPSVVAKKTSRTGSLKADVYDTKGKVVESISLPKEIFGAKINNQLIAQAVRVYLANQRKGTLSTKTRGQVEGSSRKIYRQKGTGRARHGSIRAPIFVKGGVVFGPKPRDYSLKLSKKMRKAALFSVLSKKAKEGKIKAIKSLEKIEPKTKLMAQVLKSLNLNGQKILLVMPKKTENIQRAGRNIQNIEISSIANLNAYQVLKNGIMLFMIDSLLELEKSNKGESK